ncbi:MAG: glycosyltransferase family 2 protein [Firmicutes bacterium]|nr:glycosyltransferase family 2 protein [Bacillota bacterium]
MEILGLIIKVLTILLSLCCAYQVFYIFVIWWQMLKNKKDSDISAPLPEPQGRYAVLICARNEQTVIGDLVRSVILQDYPSEMLKAFVLADNCTDHTARCAREAGAVVYERFNTSQVGKGYALDELLGHIREDYPEGFDGYIVFDADNILKPDYVRHMDLMFRKGCDIVTSYRNSKNFGASWLAGGCGLNFIRESRYLNQARYALGISAFISGTGFAFSRKILEEMGGWPYHLISEDMEFTVDQISKGRKIAFAADCEFYDEQPLTFRQSFRQRSRWLKGTLQVLIRYRKPLWKAIFKGDFGAIDLFIYSVPMFLFTSLIFILNMILGILVARADQSLWGFLRVVGGQLVGMYGGLLFTSASAMLTEHKKIMAPGWKKLLYTFTFPLYIFTYIPLAPIALCRKLKWTPISHTVTAASMTFDVRKALAPEEEQEQVA